MGPDRTVFAALAAALALLLVPTPAPATAPMPTQTVTHTQVVGPTFFEQRTFNVPKFDPTLGTLVSIDLAGDVHDATYYALEFQCPSMSGQGSLTWENRSWCELTHGGVTDPAGSGGEAGVTLTAANTFDGTLDAAGSSGTNVHGSCDYAFSIPPLSGTAMRPFVGTGTCPVVLTLHRTEYYWNEVGCPDHAVATENEYTYTLSVTYTFS